MNFKVGDMWISSKRDTYTIAKIDNSKLYYPMRVLCLTTNKFFNCTPEGKIITFNYEDLGQLAIQLKTKEQVQETADTRKVSPC